MARNGDLILTRKRQNTPLTLVYWPAHELTIVIKSKFDTDNVNRTQSGARSRIPSPKFDHEALGDCTNSGYKE